MSYEDWVKEQMLIIESGEVSNLSCFDVLAVASKWEDKRKALDIIRMAVMRAKEEYVSIPKGFEVLCNSVTDKIILDNRLQEKENRVFESDYEKRIMEEWESLEVFAGFVNPQNQVRTVLGDIIDILAWDMDDKRPVIVELKMGYKRAEKQLIKYAGYFQNPILMSITETPVPEDKRVSFIEYYTFEEVFAGRV